MQLAKRMISGVDIWLNTPTRPLEASGTSGEKAVMNGVLNFSVLDGWWYEGYQEEAGWALTDKRSYANQAFQDEIDAATIYSTFENTILPLYYARNSKGYSPEWIQYVKNCIARIAPDYTTKRMIDDYIERFYLPAQKRDKFISANHYAKAKEIAKWKEDMSSKWDDFVVESVQVNGHDVYQAHSLNFVEGEDCNVDIVIDKKDMVGDLGVESVLVQYDSKTNKDKFVASFPLKLVKREGSKLYFSLKSPIEYTGSYKYAYRVYPNNPDIPHRMDFAYIRWI
jgi:starch phosphorylase